SMVEENLAWLALNLGHVTEAQTRFQTLAAQAQAIGRYAQAVRVLVGLAWSAWQAGDLEVVETALQQFEDVSVGRKSRDLEMAAYSLQVLAQQERGNVPGAQGAVEKLADLAAEQGDADLMNRVWALRSWLDLQAGDFASAERKARQAVQAEFVADDHWLLLAEILYRQGALDDAIQVLRRGAAVEALVARGEELKAREVQNLEMLIAGADGKIESARSKLLANEAWAVERGGWRMVAETRLALGELEASAASCPSHVAMAMTTLTLDARARGWSRTAEKAEALATKCSGEAMAAIALHR
ncbi:MAG: tetratricopeptide repeat protein, partial [Acidobacteriota bacterium]